VRPRPPRHFSDRRKQVYFCFHASVHGQKYEFVRFYGSVHGQKYKSVHFQGIADRQQRFSVFLPDPVRILFRKTPAAIRQSLITDRRSPKRSHTQKRRHFKNDAQEDILFPGSLFLLYFCRISGYFCRKRLN
jgi:hypothetical protein